MTGFPGDGQWPLITSGVIQELRHQPRLHPLSTVARDLAQFRTEATSLFNLMRNLGSSIGVSIIAFMQATNTERTAPP
jgi:DHA2 family multidrug resistance protein